MREPPSSSTDVRAPAQDVFWELHDVATYTCPGCDRGRDEVTAWHVHHINRDRDYHSRTNLVALCPSCHLGDEHDRRLADTLTDPPGVYGTDPPSVGKTGPGP